MSKVTVSVSTTPAVLAAGLMAGLLRIAILDTAGSVVQTKDVDGTTVEFDDVGAGAYSASAQRLDSTGADLGTPVSAPFTVAAADSNAGAAGGADGGSYDAPATINVSVS